MMEKPQEELASFYYASGVSSRYVISRNVKSSLQKYVKSFLQIIATDLTDMLIVDIIAKTKIHIVKI